MNYEEAKAFATGHFQGLQYVTRYLEKNVYDRIQEQLNLTPRENAIIGLFLRTLCWMQSLSKLDDAKDFQPINAGIRALLEITVDIALLHNDKGEDSAKKMAAWEDSALLKVAETLINFYQQRKKIAIPDQYKSREGFVKTQKTAIEDLRRFYWKDNKHPERWTGSGSLLVDIIKVDEKYPNLFTQDLGYTLEEFYEAHYRRMNWYVHGRGLTGIRIDTPKYFFQLCAFGFRWSSDLAMICAKLVLTDFRFTNALPELDNEWKKVKSKHIELSFAQILEEMQEERDALG